MFNIYMISHNGQESNVDLERSDQRKKVTMDIFGDMILKGHPKNLFTQFFHDDTVTEFCVRDPISCGEFLVDFLC